MTTSLLRTIAQVVPKVRGTELSKAIVANITRTVIDTSLHLPDSATIEFIDADFALSNDSPMKIGDELTIGLGDSENADEMFKGEVTAIEVNTAADRPPVMIVHGYDKSHRMHRGRKSRTFLAVKDSDIASTIAGDYGLGTDVEATDFQHEYVLQDNQTDLEFLTARARRVGFELSVSDGKLRFKKPEVPGSSSPVKLTFGEQLVSFRVRMSATDQVEQVTVRGWEPIKKKMIEAKVKDSEVIPDIGGKTPAKLAASGFGEADVTVTRASLRISQEAKALATAALDEIAGDATIAEGETLGDTRLRAGVHVELANAGDTFSGKYRLTEVRHIVDQQGFRQEFTAAGRHATDVLSLVAPATTPPVPQIVPAIVTDNNDPNNLGRVKVKLPHLGDDIESDFARVLAPAAGPERGIHWIPEVDDEVLVVGTDMHQLFVLGALWSETDKPPNEEAVSSGKVNIRTIRSRSGHLIEFDDTDGAEKVTIRDKTEGNSIVIDSQADSITIESAGDITLKAQGEVLISSQKAMSMKSQMELELAGESGAKIDTSGSLSIKGTDIAVEGKAKAELKGAIVTVEASGIATLKGTMVKIN